MNTLRAIIVDDEPPARRRLRALLGGHPDVQIAAECATGREAVAAIRREDPDVLFLDIQMPGADGFAVIREIGVERMPAVVFVTAHDEHAVRAFEVNALDYLLKPFDEPRLALTLDRVRHLLAAPGGSQADFRRRVHAAIAELTSEPRYRTRLAIKSAGRIQFLPVEEIDWIDAAGKYVVIHARAAEHLHRVAIGQIETELDPQRFARIHRSTIVNIERIRELQPLFHGEYAVILRDGTELVLSRGYRAKLRALLDLPDPLPTDDSTLPPESDR